jgi:phosphinothricin acetyltransferase
VLPAVGFKHGRWVDVVQMRRPLNGGSLSLPDVAGLPLSGH